MHDFYMACLLLGTCSPPNLRTCIRISPVGSNTEFSTILDHFKIAHIQEYVLLLYDLTMLNSAVSSVQHQITLR